MLRILKMDRRNLRETLSATIKMAVKDMKAVEKKKGCSIDMTNWFKYRPESGRCTGCMAGAVMLMGCKEIRNSGLLPQGAGSFGSAWRLTFTALDYVRQGKVRIAAHHFYDSPALLSRSQRGALVKADDTFIAYESDNPKPFYASMRKIVSVLKEVGL